MKNMKFPQNVNTPLEKTEFCLIAQEKLRIKHNEMGDKYRNGLITINQWEDFLNNNFDPKQRMISKFLNNQKELLKKSNKYNVDINDIEE